MEGLQAFETRNTFNVYVREGCYHYAIVGLDRLVAAAFETRESELPGRDHTHYAAALLPGDERGITTLVIAEWEPGQLAPRIERAEQVRVGHNPDLAVYEHIVDRLSALRCEASRLEEQSFLSVPERRLRLEASSAALREREVERKLALQMQRELAALTI